MTNEIPIRAVTDQLLSKHAKKKKKLLDTEVESVSEDTQAQTTEIISVENQMSLSPEEQLLEDKPSGFGPATPVFSPSLLGGLVGAVGLATGSSSGNTSSGVEQIASQPQPTMADMMNMMLGMMLKGMPPEQMSAMISQMMDTFTIQLSTSEKPFDDMANAFGVMLSAFINQFNQNLSFEDVDVQSDTASPIEVLAFNAGLIMRQMATSMTGETELNSAADKMVSYFMNLMRPEVSASDLINTTQNISKFIDSFYKLVSNANTEFSEYIYLLLNGLNERIGVINSLILNRSVFLENNLLSVESLNDQLTVFLKISEDIGLISDYISNISDKILVAQVVSSKDFITLQAKVEGLFEFFEHQKYLLLDIPSLNQTVIDIEQSIDELNKFFGIQKNITNTYEEDLFFIGNMTSYFNMSSLDNFFSSIVKCSEENMQLFPIHKILQNLEQMIGSNSIDGLSAMSLDMIRIMKDILSALPVDKFENMISVLANSLIEKMKNSEDPFVEMANTMGSMMHALMDGMTGNTSEQPLQSFALGMGSMMHQFMKGLTGQADSAKAFGDLMGSMMGSIMRGMTGNATDPLQAVSNTMSDMMSHFMSDMSNNILKGMDPMLKLMDTMISSMDGNMSLIAKMFDKTNETAQSLISQSPSYITTILRLSDDIGLMADRIGDMADRIVQTQLIQSPNFLATQQNALSLVSLLQKNESEVLAALNGVYGQQPNFNAESMLSSMLVNLRKINGFSDFSNYFPSQLYVLNEDGSLTSISEHSLLSDDGLSLDISQFVNGQKLLIGYTMPNTQQMTISELLALTKLIDSGSFALSDLPMIPTDSSMISITQISDFMSQFSGLFLGTSYSNYGLSINNSPSAMYDNLNAFLPMMQNFLSGMNLSSMMPLFDNMVNSMLPNAKSNLLFDQFGQLYNQSLNKFMGDIPVSSMSNLMTVLMNNFTNEVVTTDNVFDNMANTMGSMMYSFMDGMTGNKSDQPLQTFALSMGEMMHQFMKGLTGEADSARAFGDMMGSMMGNMMRGMTGNASNPLQVFTTNMSDMMGRFMSDMSGNVLKVMDPMLKLMDTMISSMDGNMSLIANMFDKTNETAQSLISQSPSYITTILRLSDDIGLMADRIGDMADRIVQTQLIQSPNFLATQQNALSLVNILQNNKGDLLQAFHHVYASQPSFDVDSLYSSIITNLSKINQLAPSNGGLSLFPSILFVQDESGVITNISESSLINEDGSRDVSDFLAGKKLLIGFNIPTSNSITLSDLIQNTYLIGQGEIDFTKLPLFNMFGSTTSIGQINESLASMISLFTGSEYGSFSGLNEKSQSSFLELMQAFMSPSTMTTNGFNSLLAELVGSLNPTAYVQSISDMNTTTVSLMTNDFGNMSVSYFNQMMTKMLSDYFNATNYHANPIEMMSYTMGSMMNSFMEGMLKQNQEPLELSSSQNFALQIGDMFRHFMIGMTGNTQAQSEAAGEMMGVMIASFMQEITGDNSAPFNSFVETMTTFMNEFMLDFTQSASVMIEPMAEATKTVMLAIEANLSTLNDMFEQLNNSAQSAIEFTPNYFQGILRLSADIGVMADRIGNMADKIVATESIQSVNFLATQKNALLLMSKINSIDNLSNSMAQTDYSTLVNNINKLDDVLSKFTGFSSLNYPSVVSPSVLYVLGDNGQITTLNETSLFNFNNNSIDISQFIDGKSVLVGYHLPLNNDASVADLIEYAKIVQKQDFTLEMLPMFEQSKSIIDINQLLGTKFSAMTLQETNLPLAQFNLMLTSFKSHTNNGSSVFSSMGDVLGNMMITFMQGMTKAEVSSDAPKAFAQQMGEMMRQFMIGATGSVEQTSAQLGKMMGSMTGAFLAEVSSDNSAETKFVTSMSQSFDKLSKTASESILSLMSESDTLVQTLIDSLDANLFLLNQSFNLFNETFDKINDQKDIFIDSMLLLSKDILSMADRINEMADRIVQTQVIMSDNFLTTQKNIIELFASIKDHQDYVKNILGDNNFNVLINNLEKSINQLSNAKSSVEPMEYSSQLYVLKNNGELISLSENQFLSADGSYINIEDFMSGSTILVGYTIPTSSIMSMEQTISSTTSLKNNLNVLSLPLISSDITVDMTSMIRSMIDMMLGKALNIPFEESISTNCLTVIDNFSLSMGVSRNEFENLFNRMMDTMLGNQFFSTIVASSEALIQSMHMHDFLTPKQIVHSLMDTFFANGTPMAIMVDTMGSMMSSLAGSVTGFGVNATPLEIAYGSGELMKSFMIGLTGDEDSPMRSMTDMMGEMMNGFMLQTVGDGESFKTAINEMMHHMSDTFVFDLANIADEVNSNFIGFTSALNQTVDQLEYMFTSTVFDADYSDVFQHSVQELSSDVVQMVDKIGNMIDKVDQTIHLQTDNLISTRQNLETFIELLEDSPESSPLVTSVLTQLNQAYGELNQHIVI